MSAGALLLAWALTVAAGDLGGHHPPSQAEEAAPADARQLKLEEFWRRGILPPDQSAWSPADEDLLNRIRGSEAGAIAYLTRKFGDARPWVRRRGAKVGRAPLLTRAGYEKYMNQISQDAIAFFEEKGADAKWAFKLQDTGGKPIFDGNGRLTDAGLSLYQRAALNLEAFWVGPNGQRYGTRRPPAQTPAFSHP